MGIWIIGVDPGLHGGIALLDPNGNAVAIERPPLIAEPKSNGKTRNKMNLPEVIRILWNLKAKASEVGGDGARVVVYMEQVSSRPTDGGIQAFAFGRNVGQWEGIVVALQLPYNSVHPSVWKKEMVAKTVAIPKLPDEMSKKQKSRVHGQVTKARKFAAVEMANRMFPNHSAMFTKSTGDGPAEAVLIAEWGRRRENSVQVPKLKVEKITIPVPALDPVDPEIPEIPKE